MLLKALEKTKKESEEKAKEALGQAKKYDTQNVDDTEEREELNSSEVTENAAIKGISGIENTQQIPETKKTPFFNLFNKVLVDIILSV